MIIDFDTHISPVPEGGIGITAEELICRMDRAGIEKSCTWPYYPYRREQLEEYNRYVYTSVRKFPDRLAGFGWIDPALGLEQAVAQTSACMKEYGFYGIKLNGSQNNFRYDDFHLVCPIVDVVAESGGIVALHVGADCPQRTHPYFVMKLARRYPDTNFMLIHMGGVSYPDISDCAVEAAQECPNIYLVGSHIYAVSIRKAVEKLGAGRVCFGSDAPFNLSHVEAAKYAALLGDLPGDEQAQVMGRNAEKILGAVDRARSGG